MKYMVHFRIISIFSLLLIFSCNSKKRETVNEVFSYVPELQNRQLDLSFLPEKTYNSYSGSAFWNDPENKILVFVNFDCIRCVEDLKKWEDIARKKKVHRVMFVAMGEENDYFQYEISKSKNLLPIFWDRQDVFSDNNHLNRYNDGTFLLNNNNEVILFGYPTSDATIMKLFLSKL